MNSARTHSVYPRYSCGSPALVDERTALGVAEDERHGYQAALSGVYGPEQQKRAKALGLSGIVERHRARAHHTDFEDELTGEKGMRKRGVRTVTHRPAQDISVSFDTPGTDSEPVINHDANSQP